MKQPNRSAAPDADHGPFRAFTVTVVDRHHKRTRYPAIARTWYEAWLTAANTYGLACLVTVVPFRPRPAA